MEDNKSQSQSQRLVERLIYNMLVLLNENGGELRSSEVEQQISERLSFDEWESQAYENGGSRWRSYLHFYSIDCVKAGFLIKNKGVWYLTDSGREALQTMNEGQIRTAAHQAYREWKKSQDKKLECEDGESTNVSFFDEIKTKSDEDLMGFLQSRNPYEFQDLVAALFRAMGYYTPFIAPRGRDGGVDIIAYSDPLGATKPILKVQVKHYSPNNPVPVEVIRNIIAVANADVPIVVTSGRFTDTAKQEARYHNVRLIDGAEFTNLWIEYYSKIPEDDKSKMPIEPVYFIKRNE